MWNEERRERERDGERWREVERERERERERETEISPTMKTYAVYGPVAQPLLQEVES